MTWLLVVVAVAGVALAFAWFVFHPFGFGDTTPPLPDGDPPAAKIGRPPKSPPEPPAPLGP